MGRFSNLSNWNLQPAAESQAALRSQAGQAAGDQYNALLDQAAAQAASPAPSGFLPAPSTPSLSPQWSPAPEAQYSLPPVPARPAPQGWLDSAGRSFQSGLAGTGSMFAGAAGMLGNTDAQAGIQKWTGDTIQGLAPEQYARPDASMGEKLLDPDWWKTTAFQALGSGAGSMGVSLIASVPLLAATAFAPEIAGAVGISVGVARVIGILATTLGHAGIDSVMESASAYQEARVAGKSESEASTIASTVGANNMLLNVGLEAIPGFGELSKVGTAITKGAIRGGVVKTLEHEWGNEAVASARQRLASELTQQGWMTGARTLVTGAAKGAAEEYLQERQQGEIQKAATDGRPWDLARALTSHELDDDGLAGALISLAGGGIAGAGRQVFRAGRALASPSPQLGIQGGGAIGGPQAELPEQPRTLQQVPAPAAASTSTGNGGSGSVPPPPRPTATPDGAAGFSLPLSPEGTQIVVNGQTYQIKDKAGGGRTSDTYFADSLTNPDDQIVIKRIKRDQGALKTLIASEYATLQSLYEAGASVPKPILLNENPADGSNPYFIMGLAKGEPLRNILLQFKDYTFPEPYAVSLGINILDVLEKLAAKQKQYMDWDLTNIFWNPGVAITQTGTYQTEGKRLALQDMVGDAKQQAAVASDRVTIIDLGLLIDIPDTDATGEAEGSMLRHFWSEWMTLLSGQVLNPTKNESVDDYEGRLINAMPNVSRALLAIMAEARTSKEALPDGPEAITNTKKSLEYIRDMWYGGDREDVIRQKLGAVETTPAQVSTEQRPGPDAGARATTEQRPEPVPAPATQSGEGGGVLPPVNPPQTSNDAGEAEDKFETDPILKELVGKLTSGEPAIATLFSDGRLLPGKLVGIVPHWNSRLSKAGRPANRVTAEELAKYINRDMPELPVPEVQARPAQARPAQARPAPVGRAQIVPELQQVPQDVLDSWAEDVRSGEPMENILADAKAAFPGQGDDIEARLRKAVDERPSEAVSASPQTDPFADDQPIDERAEGAGSDEEPVDFRAFAPDLPTADTAREDKIADEVQNALARLRDLRSLPTVTRATLEAAIRSNAPSVIDVVDRLAGTVNGIAGGLASDKWERSDAARELLRELTPQENTITFWAALSGDDNSVRRDAQMLIDWKKEARRGRTEGTFGRFMRQGPGQGMADSVLEGRAAALAPVVNVSQVQIDPRQQSGKTTAYYKIQVDTEAASRLKTPLYEGQRAIDDVQPGIYARPVDRTAARERFSWDDPAALAKITDEIKRALGIRAQMFPIAQKDLVERKGSGPRPTEVGQRVRVVSSTGTVGGIGAGTTGAVTEVISPPMINQDETVTEGKVVIEWDAPDGGRALVPATMSTTHLEVAGDQAELDERLQGQELNADGTPAEDRTPGTLNNAKGQPDWQVQHAFARMRALREGRNGGLPQPKTARQIAGAIWAQDIPEGEERTRYLRGLASELYRLSLDPWRSLGDSTAEDIKARRVDPAREDAVEVRTTTRGVQQFNVFNETWYDISDLATKYNRDLVAARNQDAQNERQDQLNAKLVDVYQDLQGDEVPNRIQRLIDGRSQTTDAGQGLSDAEINGINQDIVNAIQASIDNESWKMIEAEANDHVEEADIQAETLPISQEDVATLERQWAEIRDVRQGLPSALGKSNGNEDRHQWIMNVGDAYRTVNSERTVDDIRHLPDYRGMDEGQLAEALSNIKNGVNRLFRDTSGDQMIMALGMPGQSDSFIQRVAHVLKAANDVRVQGLRAAGNRSIRNPLAYYLGSLLAQGNKLGTRNERIKAIANRAIDVLAPYMDGSTELEVTSPFRQAVRSAYSIVVTKFGRPGEGKRARFRWTQNAKEAQTYFSNELARNGLVDIEDGKLFSGRRVEVGDEVTVPGRGDARVITADVRDTSQAGQGRVRELWYTVEWTSGEDAGQTKQMRASDLVAARGSEYEGLDGENFVAYATRPARAKGSVTGPDGRQAWDTIAGWDVALFRKDKETRDQAASAIWNRLLADAATDNGGTPQAHTASSRQAVQALAQLAGLHATRDLSGRRMFPATVPLLRSAIDRHAEGADSWYDASALKAQFDEALARWIAQTRIRTLGMSDAPGLPSRIMQVRDLQGPQRTISQAASVIGITADQARSLEGDPPDRVLQELASGRGVDREVVDAWRQRVKSLTEPRTDKVMRKGPGGVESERETLTPASIARLLGITEETARVVRDEAGNVVKGAGILAEVASLLSEGGQYRNAANERRRAGPRQTGDLGIVDRQSATNNADARELMPAIASAVQTTGLNREGTSTRGIRQAAEQVVRGQPQELDEEVTAEEAVAAPSEQDAVPAALPAMNVFANRTATAAGLTAERFRGRTPSGPRGQFTVADVEAIVNDGSAETALSPTSVPDPALGTAGQEPQAPAPDNAGIVRTFLSTNGPSSINQVVTGTRLSRAGVLGVLNDQSNGFIQEMTGRQQRWSTPAQEGSAGTSVEQAVEKVPAPVQAGEGATTGEVNLGPPPSTTTGLDPEIQQLLDNEKIRLERGYPVRSIDEAEQEFGLDGDGSEGDDGAPVRRSRATRGPAQGASRQAAPQWTSVQSIRDAIDANAANADSQQPLVILAVTNADDARRILTDGLEPQAFDDFNAGMQELGVSAADVVMNLKRATGNVTDRSKTFIIIARVEDDGPIGPKNIIGVAPLSAFLPHTVSLFGGSPPQDASPEDARLETVADRRSGIVGGGSITQEGQPPRVARPRPNGVAGGGAVLGSSVEDIAQANARQPEPVATGGALVRDGATRTLTSEDRETIRFRKQLNDLAMETLRTFLPGVTVTVGDIRKLIKPLGMPAAQATDAIETLVGMGILSPAPAVTTEGVEQLRREPAYIMSLDAFSDIFDDQVVPFAVPGQEQYARLFYKGILADGSIRLMNNGKPGRLPKGTPIRVLLPDGAMLPTRAQEYINREVEGPVDQGPGDQGPGDQGSGDQGSGDQETPPPAEPPDRPGDPPRSGDGTPPGSGDGNALAPVDLPQDRRSWWDRFKGLFGMANSYRFANMLSNPASTMNEFVTQIGNVLSLRFQAGMAAGLEDRAGLSPSERKMTKEMSRGTTTLSDGTVIGWGSGIMDGMQMALQVMRTGDNPEALKVAEQTGGRNRFVNQELLRDAMGREFGETGRKIGNVIGMPMRIRMANDILFAMVGESIGIHMMANREAARDGLKAGTPEYGERVVKFADAIRDELYLGRKEAPDRSDRLVPGADAARIKRVTEEASNIARNLVWQGNMKSLSFGLEEARWASPVMKFIIPFMQVGARIAQAGADMTPGLGQALMGWDIARGDYGNPAAITSVKSLLAADPKDKSVRPASMRLAAQGMGLMVSGVGASLAMAGLLTGAGPDDDREKAAWLADGKRPYSLKIGGTYVNAALVLGPLAWPLVAGALMFDAATGKNKAVAPTAETWQNLAGAVDEWIFNQTALSNLSRVIDATQNKGSGKEMQRWISSSVIAPFVPYSSALRAMANASDDMKRDPQTIIDFMKMYFPGASQGVKAKTDDLFKQQGRTAAERYLPFVSSVEQASDRPYAVIGAKSQQEATRIRQAQGLVAEYFRNPLTAPKPTEADFTMVLRYGRDPSRYYETQRKVGKLVAERTAVA